MTLDNICSIKIIIAFLLIISQIINFLPSFINYGFVVYCQPIFIIIKIYYNHHYQEDRDLRDKYIGHQYYEATINFCHKWDQASFDPNYNTIPLEEFIPMVGRIFNRDPYKNL